MGATATTEKAGLRRGQFATTLLVGIAAAVFSSIAIAGSDRDVASAVVGAQHYIAYELNQPERFFENVTLQDRFATIRVGVEEAEFLMVPAEKRRTGHPISPISDPTAHLECHGISIDSFPERTVTASNQFYSSHTLTLGRPTWLCTPAVPASGGAQSGAVSLTGQGAGTLTAAVTNNTIRQNDGFAAIDILSRDGSPTINATVTGNSIANPSAGGGNGFLLRNGAVTTDGGFTCLALTGNTLAGSAVLGLDDFRLRQRFNTTVRLPGYGGTAGDTAAVVSFVQGNNPGAETGSATADFPATGGGFVGGAACPTPP